MTSPLSVKIAFFGCVFFLVLSSARTVAAPPVQHDIFPDPGQVHLGGVLGQALAVNHTARLMHFVEDETSKPIALFAPENVAKNTDGDWYGEHAGKWLYAAARAANRTGDAELAAHVRRVADYLVGRQEADGYLGTYAPQSRFTRKEALGKRTWDIWVHSYLILGLLEVNKYQPNPKYVDAARRIGDLCLRTLTEGGFNIADLGNHYGLSATVLLDPATELYFATGDQRYLNLAHLVLKQANERAGLELVPKTLAGTDAAAIVDGKAYQLCWNYVGLIKLYRATGDEQYLRAVQTVWENIRQFHLTLGGGPWGGVGDKSREVFNPQAVFSPYGYVETCSTFSWIQLNRELFRMSGDAKYAEEIEKSAYNDLLGAQDADGANWCYYSFPNGKRVMTTYWRCCKSSGAMGLEELPSLSYSVTANKAISINLYGAGEATLTTPQAGHVTLTQTTAYPFEGNIRITVKPEKEAKYAILVRIPAWADKAIASVNGKVAEQPATPGKFLALERVWRTNDEITLQFPMTPSLHEKTNRSLQEAKLPDGSAISQEVLHVDYVAITRGPLVYATGLIDGFKSEETIRLPKNRSADLMEVVSAPAGTEGKAISLKLGYRPALTFLPYFESGGRKDGTWRLTWMQLAEN